MWCEKESERQKELRERRRKLNEAFVWTEENIKKLLKFNDHIRKMAEEAYNNIIQMMKDFEEKIREGHAVYEDYDIDAEIEPVKSIIHDLDQDTADGLYFNENWDVLNSHWHADRRYSVEDIEKAKKENLEENWSNGELRDVLEEHFQDVPMHWFTHHIISHSRCYAYQDVLNIELSDLRIWYKVSL